MWRFGGIYLAIYLIGGHLNDPLNQKGIHSLNMYIELDVKMRRENCTKY